MLYPAYPRFRGVSQDGKPLICSRKLTLCLLKASYYMILSCKVHSWFPALLWQMLPHMNVAGVPHFTDRPRHILIDQHIIRWWAMCQPRVISSAGHGQFASSHVHVIGKSALSLFHVLSQIITLEWVSTLLHMACSELKHSSKMSSSSSSSSSSSPFHHMFP